MKLKNYSAKPKPIFLGKGDYHIGIELEMEAPNSKAYSAGLLLKDNPRFCYAKPDGSLRHGWELVTQPIPVHKWLEAKPRKYSAIDQMFTMIGDLKKLQYESHNTPTCGLHVHICRKALSLNIEPPLIGGRDYSRMTPNQLREFERQYRAEYDKARTKSQQYYWFRRLLHGKLFAEISQRTAKQLAMWCGQYHESYKQPRRGIQNGRRYEAVNLTRNTVEVRIFRGNMREDRIRKNIEAVISAVSWAKTVAGKSSQVYKRGKSDDRLFIEYVTGNQKMYPNLYNYLKEIGATQLNWKPNTLEYYNEGEAPEGFDEMGDEESCECGEYSCDYCHGDWCDCDYCYHNSGRCEGGQCLHCHSEGRCQNGQCRYCHSEGSCQASECEYRHTDTGSPLEDRVSSITGVQF